MHLSVFKVCSNLGHKIKLFIASVGPPSHALCVSPQFLALVQAAPMGSFCAAPLLPSVCPDE